MTLTAQLDPRTESAALCMLCGQSAWETHLSSVLDYLTDEHFDIDRCVGCGLLITRPMPTEAQIDRYYPARYRGNRHGFTGRMRVVLRRRAIEARFPRGFRGRLLDVGCGDGAFVLEMRRRGWEVCATELDPATVQRLQASGIDAKLPRLAAQEGFAGPFDAVTCWHVMEHVERPLQLAEWVRTQLKPDGTFQATVPNIASLQGRLFKRHWLHLDVPRHRYHFTAKTFRSLLTRAGFSAIRQGRFAIEYDWFGVIQSTLNSAGFRPNGLFERLTGPHAGGQNPGDASLFDAIASAALSVPIAALSLPAILLARLFGDGATLTLSCRPA